jgi:hypothetical protein
MERETHENLLAELLNPEIEASRKTEILQELRADYTSVHTDFETISASNDKLKRDNDDLIVSNSKLFRQTGVTTEKKDEQVEQKEFSETVTLEQLEKEQ